ncbi:PLD nuclease N-terminal domain-containing protein, partial [Pseudomonas syringae]|uniref:PLD nuclease N-terminal domain-containing protein n=2 Tax=Pseudomonas TaxID=286 RepID=UPI0018E5ECD4
IGICRSQRSAGEKAAWSIGIMLFPVLGLIVWGVAGPRGIKPGTGPSSDQHSKG